MSRLDDLIRAMPPGSVKHLPVGELVDVVPTPRGVKRERYVDGSTIPIVDQGEGLVAGFTDEESLRIPAAEHIVFGDHTRAIKWVPFEFAVGADGTKVLKSKPEVLPRYLYHSLRNLSVPSRGYSRHWAALRALAVPVPPLEVQREVVRILDTFTSLEAELEAELEARRRQRQTYLDALIHASVEQRQPLGELGKLVRGRRFTKNDFAESGIPVIHYGEIYTHYGTAATETRSFVRDEIANTLRFAQPGDLIIATTGENLRDVAKAVAWLGDIDVAIHDDSYAFKHSLNPKYASYVFQSTDFASQKGRLVTAGKLTRISGSSLAKIQVPIVSLSEQQRIVAILDQFDALVNDLSIGIPAELAARRKQYEYYRDKLLTFEEAS
ncbi:restriction endonuclease subunit S [Agromyces binzhouensis]|uniref:Restriction endonuclease subunit S n=1 Tax=Agromyces binzhouensis TaxID=1817495 RepID=A0A4V1QSY5_9MICO|nr:restriction endonuclease subunit S [Agromyces binzhouensis]RXZ50013.1 restriction endonuclease subunit S [Agromyces binzhouensis]